MCVALFVLLCVWSVCVRARSEMRVFLYVCEVCLRAQKSTFNRPPQSICTVPGSSTDCRRLRLFLDSLKMNSCIVSATRKNARTATRAYSQRAKCIVACTSRSQQCSSAAARAGACSAGDRVLATARSLPKKSKFTRLCNKHILRSAR